jgi:hypothetical protein
MWCIDQLCSLTVAGEQVGCGSGSVMMDTGPRIRIKILRIRNTGIFCCFVSFLYLKKKIFSWCKRTLMIFPGISSGSLSSSTCKSLKGLTVQAQEAAERILLFWLGGLRRTRKIFHPKRSNWRLRTTELVLAHDGCLPVIM